MTNDPQGTPTGPMPNQILDPKHQTDTNEPLFSSTIKQALAQAVIQLKHLSDPRLDAQWMLLKILNKKEASWLIAHGEERLTGKELALFSQLLARRSAGEPLAYLLGEWEFYGRSFTVNEAVLIPRPTTEKLVDEALSYIKKLVRGGLKKTERETIIIADIGTGSGCIAITIGLEIEKWLRAERLCCDWRMIATDISGTALKVARQNARRFDIKDKIDCLQGDLLQPIKERRVDLIVSNPPYVPSGELTAQATLGNDKLGLRYEPRVALDGGEDGLVFVKELLKTEVPLIYETVGGEIKNKT